tara:strand:+ start:827 stop:1252 length:426 start_codon:yes stop_codon:yes gene_type:complete
MIQVVTSDDWKEKCYEWIKPKAHIYNVHDTYAYIGLIENSNIIGVILFSDYDGNNIFIHVALDTPRACNRKIIKLMFDYVFNQAKCSRATATCDNNYDRIKKLVEGVGFEKEGVMKKMIYKENKYVDCAIYGMQKEDCKWV